MLSKFTEFIDAHEDCLMGRILEYAHNREYTKYTSTLKEAWRLSIAGLSKALIESVQIRGNDLELSPEDNYMEDPAAQFGIMEAERHRERGIRLDMFLGLIKYYCQSYLDLINESDFSTSEKKQYNTLTKRFFDRVEIGFCSTWVPYEKEPLVDELQVKNRQMTNEKNKYLTIFEGLSVPVFIIDTDGKIENKNYAASSLLDIDTVSGQSYYNDHKDILFTNEFPWMKDVYEHLIESSSPHYTCEKFHEEREQYFVVSCSRSLDVSGKFMGTIIIVEDITEKKLFHQAQLRSSQLSALGEVAAGVAHEINNPINGVINYAQLLINKNDKNDKSNQILERIMKEGRRVSNIVKSLLNFAQKDRGEFSSLSLMDLVVEPLNLNAQFFKNDGIYIDVGLPDDLPKIFGNQMQLEQVVLNLLSNARHALNKRLPKPSNEKFILIDAASLTKQNGEYVQLRIKDSGCGIPKNQMEKIFNPFFTTKEAGVGTGLGLSVTHEIIENHGATISVDSQVNKFTNVIISFPVHT